MNLNGLSAPAARPGQPAAALPRCAHRNQAGQACISFLEDLQGSHVRWGPLLAFCYLHGCEFSSAQGYLEPYVETPLYMQLADDALKGIDHWLPRLGIHRTKCAATGLWGVFGGLW